MPDMPNVHFRLEQYISTTLPRTETTTPVFDKRFLFAIALSFP